jgi:VWFA-related protein
LSAKTIVISIINLTAIPIIGSVILAQDRPSAPFRTGIEMVSLNVTVTNQLDQFVKNLEGTDFFIFEDGIKQDVTFFSRRQEPVALSLLLDSSASMEDNLATLQAAAVTFVQRLQPMDVAQVIDFDSRVEILQTFTDRKENLKEAILQITAGGSTSLHNAVYLALKELAEVQTFEDNETRRQALVVFSDGEDTSNLSKRSETAIYTISLRSSSKPQARGFDEAEFLMRQLAQETGGQIFFANNANDLSSLYAEIADELSSQYTLGYVSKNPVRNGFWRNIVVQVNQKDMTPRTKRGYYAQELN